MHLNTNFSILKSIQLSNDSHFNCFNAVAVWSCVWWYRQLCFERGPVFSSAHLVSCTWGNSSTQATRSPLTESHLHALYVKYFLTEEILLKWWLALEHTAVTWSTIVKLMSIYTPQVLYYSHRLYHSLSNCYWTLPSCLKWCADMNVIVSVLVSLILSMHCAEVSTFWYLRCMPRVYAKPSHGR